jgi:hypothetical protein
MNGRVGSKNIWSETRYRDAVPRSDRGSHFGVYPKTGRNAGRDTITIRVPGMAFLTGGASVCGEALERPPLQPYPYSAAMGIEQAPR